MKTIAAVVMVINMFGSAGEDAQGVEGVERTRTSSASVLVVGEGDAAMRQCDIAAKGTANSLAAAGQNAVVGCAFYEGPLNTDLTLIQANMYSMYQSVPVSIEE